MAKSKGLTLWFTGLPCSGKSTIAGLVAQRLQGDGERVEVLDGDEIREHFSAGVGFTREGRTQHLKRIAYLAYLLNKHGVIAIAALIAPYKENRDSARELIQESFIEIFVDTPLEECIRRDVRGMYKKAMTGEIKQFTGISDPYEEPENPDLTIQTMDETPEESAQRVLDVVTKKLSSG